MSNSLQFKTIAVAIDLGDTASSALKYAQEIARAHGSTLVLVHVIDPLAYAFPGGTHEFFATNQTPDKTANEELKKIEMETRERGIEVRSVLESGAICERILQAVKDHHADLLVLGTRSAGVAGRAALGTVARQLLARSACPVMTVPANSAARLPWAGCWSRVLAATDFSPASVDGLRSAHRVALRQLIALHVSKCGPERECTSCQGKLRLLAPFNESHTVPVEHIVAAGDAAELIAEYAGKFDVDLVVLGSPARELSEEDLPTSTVLQVIAKVTCPVLCIPVTQDSSPMGLIREITYA